MAIKASNSITLSSVVDVKAVYRYYLLQSSTLAKPSVPTAYPPPTSWSATEPSYTEGSTNSLYTVVLTLFSDNTWLYSAVSLSSSYEAAKAAYNKATSLATRVTNAETAIDQNKEAINLRATKTEVATTLSGYYTKEQTDAAISTSATDITATVSSTYATKTELSDANVDISNDINNVMSMVEAKMSADEVELKIETAINNGVDKVTTSTGYTLNQDGLTVKKSNSEMETQITEDGMTVYKNDEVVLVANNVGVDAVNLHATTYLIIGNNSRFEDYGSRTACFWIGN